jgi:hypothetical protein
MWGVGLSVAPAARQALWSGGVVMTCCEFSTNVNEKFHQF